MSKLGGAWVLGVLVLAACGDDDGGTNLNNDNLNNNNNVTDPCSGVTCSGHGTCAVAAGQATCDCEAGYHPEGLTCVEDANAAPEISSTPPGDATVLVEYVYGIACTDADGDPLTINLGVTDTCDATVTDHGDGTADYRFTPAVGTAGTTCALHVECHDASGLDIQTATVEIAPGACVLDATFTGQIRIPEPPDPASACGGVYVSGAFPAGYDAGVGALIAQVPAINLQYATVDATLVEATVTAVALVSPSFRSVWLADGTGAVKTWLPEADETQLPAFHVRVGQRVSVHALELLNYYGEAELTRVEAGSWSLVSEDAEVHVVDRTGGPDLVMADVDHVVRVAGTILGGPVACGTANFCYDLEYGGSTPTVLRVADGNVPVGLCVTWVGPLSAYDDAIQLRLYDSDWARGH